LQHGSGKARVTKILHTNKLLGVGRAITRPGLGRELLVKTLFSGVIKLLAIPTRAFVFEPAVLVLMPGLLADGAADKRLAPPPEPAVLALVSI
jgi:hypothetical protein